MRILVTITPRMYREAIAGYLLQHRPGYEVRSSAPADAEEEVILFAPHLLVHMTPMGLDAGVLRGVRPVGSRCSTATAWARGSAWKGASRSTRTSPRRFYCGLLTKPRPRCVNPRAEPYSPNLLEDPL